MNKNIAHNALIDKTWMQILKPNTHTKKIYFDKHRCPNQMLNNRYFSAMWNIQSIECMWKSVSEASVYIKYNGILDLFDLWNFLWDNSHIYAHT